MPGTDVAETVVVANPNSGDGGHVEQVRERASLLGYDLWESEREGDPVELAREAAAGGASTVVAAGGDGTVNEVLQGIDRADALDSVAFGVVPVGTGNNFAENVGVTGVADAFDVLEGGRRRRIDVGRTGDRVFVNSCVAGLTADASGNTSDSMKRRLGALAYVVTTLRSLPDYQSLPVSVDIQEDGRETTAWAGDAMMVLVGNARRFVWGDQTQADVEDGLFEVTVVEELSVTDAVGEAVFGRLFAGDSEHVTRFRAPALSVRVRDPTATRFSLDGEILRRESLSMHTDPGAATVAVGDAYDPDPGLQ
ncbi:YegS/Rv2252/BmrU family lipid kinase [Halobacterium sp. NMX12-1]|uniref:YegS/Rv2252/BmrU family lipid kinase n=1 Tax=Halobacterium sp. NMX12-1 TaxID=3166650 RepID=A0AAU8CBG5_9EURY